MEGKFEKYFSPNPGPATDLIRIGPAAAVIRVVRLNPKRLLAA
jgi:hypothetical protein